MTISHKYTMNDPDEQHGVLVNKLGILEQKKLNAVEAQHLLKSYEQVTSQYTKKHSFREKDICYLHKVFLGDIYEWPGNYRTIDLSSKGIRFCHAKFIPENMQTFSKQLAELTPFTPDLSKKEIALRLAVIHGELIVIHPFRDGNGRTTRLLCDILLLQADCIPMKTKKFYDRFFVEKYHRSIQKIWHSKDYSSLSDLFEPLIGN